MGVSGESSQHNFLEYNIEKLVDLTDNPLEAIERVREIFSKGERLVDDDKSPTPNYEISGILAHKDGGIWDVDKGLSIARMPSNKLWARGSGVDYALGASDALEYLSLPAEKLILKATQAAINCDVYCPGKAAVIKL